MSERTYYFDYAASAPRLDEVAEAMAPWEHGLVGNPSGAHHLARKARQAIEDARDVVAEFVGGSPYEVIFTAGGTESCHLALTGVVQAHRATHERSQLVVSPVEHDAVLKTAEWLATTFDDVDLTYLDVVHNGVVTSDSLWAAMTPETALVSVMTVNNETGVCQPIPIVASIAKGGVPGGAISHTDAIAAASTLYLPAVTDAMDMVSICGHKLGGPVNSGALVLRDNIPLAVGNPGGGQERGHRGGTVDVAAAVGLAAACRVVNEPRADTQVRLRTLQERIISAVRFLPGVEVTALDEAVVAGTVHLTAAGLASDELLFLLDQAGVCASAGSSCSSGAAVSSHVLAAMGMPAERARGALRFTMGAETTSDEVDYLITALSDAVYRLRGER